MGLASVVEMMYAIGVVPEDAEIGRSAGHGCEACDGIVRVCDASRVGVLGDAPYSLDSIVFADEGFYFVHVRSVFVHADGNHLDAEKLGDGEVAVVSGNRAEPRYVLELAPGLLAEIAVQKTVAHKVVHDVEA